MKNRIIALMVLGLCASVSLATPYYFETASNNNVWVEVDAWVGSGNCETILVIDWNFMNGPYATESHAFGYRWDGTATTEQQMLEAFQNAGVFSMDSGYGGTFIYDFIYNNGVDSHTHSDEPGSWGYASTSDPSSNWCDGWSTTQWNANCAGINQEYISDGQFEGLNAIYFYGSYPAGETCADYGLDIPFATPEPATMLLLGIGVVLVRRKRS